MCLARDKCLQANRSPFFPSILNICFHSGWFPLRRTLFICSGAIISDSLRHAAKRQRELENRPRDWPRCMHFAEFKAFYSNRVESWCERVPAGCGLSPSSPGPPWSSSGNDRWCPPLRKQGMKHGLGILTKFNQNTSQQNSRALLYIIVNKNLSDVQFIHIWEVFGHLGRSGGSQGHIHKPQGGPRFQYFF